MAGRDTEKLSRRERQVLDVIWSAGEATAQEVLEALPDPPSYSAVRATLRIMVEKGILKHRKDGNRYVFSPVSSRKAASRSAVRRLLETFYRGSPSDAFAALLDVSGKELDEDDFDRLQAMIDKAREEGR